LQLRSLGRTIWLDHDGSRTMRACEVAVGNAFGSGLCHFPQ
jgi:hypothetical protein